MITNVQPIRYNNVPAYSINSQNKNTAQSNTATNTIQSTHLNPQLLQNYYVSFKGGKSDDLTAAYRKTNGAEYVEDSAIALAKSYCHKEIGPWHIIHCALADTIEYIDAIGDDEYREDSASSEDAYQFFSSIQGDIIFKNKDYRKQVKKVLEDNLQIVDEQLSTIPKEKKTTNPSFSKNLIRNIIYVKSAMNDGDISELNAIDYYNGAFASENKTVNTYFDNLNLRLRDVYQINNDKTDNRLYFPTYDKQADNIMRNLNMGTSMFVTYDSDKVNPTYFIPNVKKALERSKGPLTAENTEIIEFNENVKMGYFSDKIYELSKNKDKNYIVLFSQTDLSGNAVQFDASGTPIVVYTDEYQTTLKNPPKNVKYVAFETKDAYLNHSQHPTLSKIYNEMGEASIPVLKKDDVKKALLSNPDASLTRDGQSFSKQAIDRVVNTSEQMDGKFPDKTMHLMKKISGYYIDKDNITPKDVDNYAKNAGHLFKQSDDDSSVEIVFDTGKRLKDIVGKNNTKKEAENIIRQIKSNKMGTKGFLIYSQDGSIGAGRRHTAEVIAGESKVPFISTDAMDFGTKDVDLFGGSSMTPEASMKKLFSTVMTQAETNPHKSAVLFIDNFDYFSIGEMFSEHRQKAMAQMVREMANADRKGLNIAVIGSVTNPNILGDKTAKSSRFNDTIEVSTPAINYEERYEVLKHASKKNKIKLAGTPEEQEKLLESYAKFLTGASFMELRDFMKKSEAIALERKKKTINKSDMTEAFMRMTTGRVNTQPLEPFEKEIITKHECGHAVTLTVMNDIIKKQNKPWLVPDEVKFITLDPRGYYGGAVYHDSDSSFGRGFENYFSGIVCSYGGHSAEKIIYNVDGSPGPYSDFQNATRTAMAMVKAFGQGPTTGKLNIDYLCLDLTNDTRKKVENDVMTITKNALSASDMIVEAYKDFINEFSDKYSSKMATGEGLIDGDQFRNEFKEWKESQPPEKQEEFELVDSMLLEIIDSSKKGKIYQ